MLKLCNNDFGINASFIKKHLNLCNRLRFTLQMTNKKLPCCSSQFSLCFSVVWIYQQMSFVCFRVKFDFSCVYISVWNHCNGNVAEEMHWRFETHSLKLWKAQTEFHGIVNKRSNSKIHVTYQTTQRISCH